MKVELRCLKDEGICTADMSLHLWEDCDFLEWRWEAMEVLCNYGNSTRNGCEGMSQIR